MLNNDVEDGLDNEFNTDAHLDLVTPPVVKAGGGNDVTFVTDLDSTEPQQRISPQELFGDNLKEGNLPNFDAEFKVIENNRVRVIELKDVESMIMNQNNISQEDARMVDSVFGGLFSSRLSEKEFTKAPSQTNFSCTASFMKMKIATEELQVMNGMASFFTAPLEGMDSFVKYIKETFEPNAIEEITAIQSEFRLVLDNIFTSKNTVLPVEQSSINILTASIDSLKLDHIGDMVQGMEEEDRNKARSNLDSAIRALTALSCPKFTHFILSCIDGNPKIASGIDTMTSDDKLTIGDLVTVYQNTCLLAGISCLSEVAYETLEAFKKNVQGLENCEQDFDSLNRFIVDNTPDVLAQSKDITNCYFLARNLILLNVAMRPVLNFLRFCL